MVLDVIKARSNNKILISKNGNKIMADNASGHASH